MKITAEFIKSMNNGTARIQAMLDGYGFDAEAVAIQSPTALAMGDRPVGIKGEFSADDKVLFTGLFGELRDWQYGVIVRHAYVA